MKQQQNLKTCIYFNEKKKEKFSEINNEKTFYVGKPNALPFRTVAVLKSQQVIHGSKLILILSILLLYTFSVKAGKTFGEMLDELGSLELDFDNEIDESNLPDYGSAEELIAAAEEDCKKADEYCEKMDKFHKYLDDFIEKF